MRKPGEQDQGGLYDDVQSATAHELEIAIGAHKPPNLPTRDIHPALLEFPPISDEEYAALKEDIRLNGQQRAISMYQGMIWDGRARYSACIELGLIPRVWILRRKPIDHLFRHNYTRFGKPYSRERGTLILIDAALHDPAWKQKEREQRSEWIKFARWKFQQIWRSSDRCQICRMDSDYSHAHHSLPLNIQYDLGISEPVHEFDWLCPTHHQFMHKVIAATLIGGRYHGREVIFKYDPTLKDESQRDAARRLFEKAEQLFAAVGGISPYGNWGMLRV
jgi:hypothetical protein